MTDTIAIDFGTMRTKLAYHDAQRNRVELMRLGLDERPFIPSLFFLGEDGRRLFGDAAAELLDSDCSGFLNNPLKRELRLQLVRAGNRARATPTELLSILFGGLRTRTKEIACFHGALPTGIVLTVPAQYGPPDKDILTAAAREAGFLCITFIDEPISAAQAWLAETGGNEEYVVVLDCGGGTLDWACLQRTSVGKFDVIPALPPGGDNRIGGYDIDEELFGRVDDAVSDEGNRAELKDKRSHIQNQIRMLKEKHSRTGAGGQIRVGNASVDIPAEVVDDIIMHRYISQACQNLSSFLEKVRDRLKIETPTVLLVGGSARLRGFKEVLAQQCRCKPVLWERSEYATVLGALQDAVTQNQGPVRHPQNPASAKVILHARARQPMLVRQPQKPVSAKGLPDDKLQNEVGSPAQKEVKPPPYRKPEVQATQEQPPAVQPRKKKRSCFVRCLGFAVIIWGLLLILYGQGYLLHGIIIILIGFCII